MSAEGDLRDDLERIHGMLPLSDRERWLAERVLFGDGESGVAGDIENEPKWWGEKAVAAAKYLMGQEAIG